MLFSSVPFLFYFLPAVLLVYFFVPKRAKNGVLLLSSLVFYGWGEPRYLPVMLVSILQGYIFGRLIERFRDTRRAKLFLVLSVLLSLGTLAYFKYADFMIANLNALTGLSVPLLRLALPVGISFYTFQILSYTVDVYRGTVPAQRNFIDLAAYIAMFPQLIAGPIVRYSDIAVQLKTREHSVSEAASGARRFILGLAKKILLANLLGELVSSFRASADLSVLYYWLGAIAFTLQIYYDFSGYSDMAIGLGRIFGFRFPENFQYPYLSGSITEFWRRWHISLGSWFRDYLYIPLGGNRKGSARQLLNILLVWLATGLWHGAAWNFVLWGLLYAVLLTAEKLFLLRGLQKLHVLNHVYVLLFVTLGFVLFDASSVQDAAQSIRAMFGGGGLPLVSAESLYELRSCTVLLLLAVAGATPLAKSLCAAVQRSRAGKPALAVLEPVGLTALLAVCTACLGDGSCNPPVFPVLEGRPHGKTKESCSRLPDGGVPARISGLEPSEAG